MKFLNYLYDYGLEFRVVRNADVALLVVAGLLVGAVGHAIFF
jgi:hypothetical protein